MMLAAGGTAAVWGASDFIAGILARRLPVTTVLIWSKTFGMALATLVVAARGVPALDRPGLLLAAAAGLVGLPAMGLLYRAMRDGSLTVVAPVAATAALVPVGWGMLGGERFGVAGAVGVAVALVGVTLASWPVGGGRGPVRTATMLSALGAALGFGAYFVLLHEASHTDPYGATAVARICGGVGALALAAGLRLRLRTVGRSLRLRTAGRGLRRRGAPAERRGRTGRPRGIGPVLAMSGIGALDAAGDGAFALAAHHGPLGSAALLASMYPAVTVLLNRSVLRERMHTVHFWGVLAALLAVACLAG